MKIWALMIAAVAAAPLAAQNGTTGTTDRENTMQQQDPRSQDDGSWIAIKGTVKSVGHDDFLLDHGNGTITVKLQPEEAQEKEHEFIKDESVTVFGVVDENFFKSTTILARAVYVESLSTYVYRTDGVDEFITMATPVIPSGTVVHGTIKKVEADKIMIDEGDRMITVDTSLLTKDEDPATLESTAGLSEGDEVVAVGVMDKDFWTGRTFRATSLLSADPMNDGEMQGSSTDY